MATKSKGLRNKAQSHFTASQRRDSAFQTIVEHERSQRDAKNAKLRALRIAKEAADQEAADKLAAENASKPKPARAARKKPARAAAKANLIET